MAKAVSSIDPFEKPREFSNRVRVIRVGSKGSISFKVLPDDKIVLMLLLKQKSRSITAVGVWEPAERAEFM